MAVACASVCVMMFQISDASQPQNFRFCQPMDELVLAKRDLLEVSIETRGRVRELAQQEFFPRAQDASDPHCIPFPPVSACEIPVTLPLDFDFRA
jgi:hypothetical protein